MSEHIWRALAVINSRRATVALQDQATQRSTCVRSAAYLLLWKRKVEEYTLFPRNQRIVSPWIKTTLEWICFYLGPRRGSWRIERKLTWVATIAQFNLQLGREPTCQYSGIPRVGLSHCQEPTWGLRYADVAATCIDPEHQNQQCMVCIEFIYRTIMGQDSSISNSL